MELEFRVTSQIFPVLDYLSGQVVGYFYSIFIEMLTTNVTVPYVL